LINSPQKEIKNLEENQLLLVVSQQLPFVNPATKADQFSLGFLYL
jgi:hypothetical protein